MSLLLPAAKHSVVASCRGIHGRLVRIDVDVDRPTEMPRFCCETHIELHYKTRTTAQRPLPDADHHGLRLRRFATVDPEPEAAADRKGPVDHSLTGQSTILSITDNEPMDYEFIGTGFEPGEPRRIARCSIFTSPPAYVQWLYYAATRTSPDAALELPPTVNRRHATHDQEDAL